LTLVSKVLPLSAPPLLPLHPALLPSLLSYLPIHVPPPFLLLLPSPSLFPFLLLALLPYLQHCATSGGGAKGQAWGRGHPFFLLHPVVLPLFLLF
jgi:hypothetical protein